MITSISIFPSGNFLSLSWDRTTTIYDKISDYIISVSIKDENTFAISLYDKIIKIYKKIEDKYIIFFNWKKLRRNCK